MKRTTFETIFIIALLIVVSGISIMSTANYTSQKFNACYDKADVEHVYKAAPPKIRLSMRKNELKFTVMNKGNKSFYVLFPSDHTVRVSWEDIVFMTPAIDNSIK